MNSEEFKKFARDFKGYIGRILPDYKIAKYEVNYYTVSAFLKTECNGYVVTIYLNYDKPRGREININDATPLFGVVVRATDNVTDYCGGRNHFASLANLSSVVDDVAQKAAKLAARNISTYENRYTAERRKDNANI